MKQKITLLIVALLVIGGLVALDRAQNAPDTSDDMIATSSNATSSPATSTTQTSNDKPTPVPTPKPLPQPTPKPTPAPAPTPAPKGITRADVALHASRSSCWTIVADSVYDLTDWIDKHPGGERAILGLCGTDGTDAFTRQHGSSSKAKAALATFRIGALAQ